MDKIYEKANDQHIQAIKVYVKPNNSYAYSDSERTTKIKAKDLSRTFDIGAVIIDGGISYKPISYWESSGVGSLAYIKPDTTTATTAVLTVIKSEEYQEQPAS